MKIIVTESEVKRMVLEGVMKVLESIYRGLEDVQDTDELTNAAVQHGFNLIGYHNTDDPDLNKEGFKFREAGIHFGSLKAAEERGESRGEVFDGYQNWTHKYFLKTENPLVIENDFHWECTSTDFGRAMANTHTDLYAYLYQVLGFEVSDGEKLYPIVNILYSHGYDAIIYKNEAEDAGNYSIAMFDPNNIKLAEMTTDDQGNPIPVEQRFNEQTNDVRY